MGVSEFKKQAWFQREGRERCSANGAARTAATAMTAHRKVQLVVSGGIRSGADVAKALAMGADACSIGTAALIALGDNSPHLDDEYRKLGSAAGFYDDFQEGQDPAGREGEFPGIQGHRF